MKNTQTAFEATIEELPSDVSFEILPRGIYHLGYTCFLIPASPAHELTDDVQKVLSSSIQDMCASHAWGLEFVMAKPLYVQWAVLMPPSVPPARVIQAARKETSLAVFNNFPRYKSEMSKGDFWALGHLTVFGIHPQLPQTIEHFIKLMRRP